MTDLNKLRSEFEAQHSDKVFKIVKFDEATNAYCLHAHLPLTEINLSALAEINYGWELWQKAKAQAVPDTHVVVPRTRKVVVAIEKMVEQQVEASGITSDVFRLDGWRILDAIQEASESGAEK
ncbi:hypothetical protein NLV80_000798 [Acinetobacter baumannii]|nr:hypothetical protein [Acinetobacter baumannii]EKT9845634.1 hypothetical protein [Acinetobacter baumannii]